MPSDGRARPCPLSRAHGGQDAREHGLKSQRVDIGAGEAVTEGGIFKGAGLPRHAPHAVEHDDHLLRR